MSDERFQTVEFNNFESESLLTKSLEFWNFNNLQGLILSQPYNFVSFIKPMSLKLRSKQMISLLESAP